VLYLFSEIATIKVSQYVTSTYLTPALIRVVGVCLITLSIFLLGVSYSDKAFKEEIDKKNAEISKINDDSKEITKDVVIKYIYMDKIIKEKGDEVIKYITVKNDADCKLHNSTIELLNSSAKGNIPDPTRATDETGSGVNLSAVTEAVVENNNKYHAVVLELTSLQEWVKEQKKNNE
jgi:hypothetical protein